MPLFATRRVTAPRTKPFEVPIIDAVTTEADAAAQGRTSASRAGTDAVRGEREGGKGAQHRQVELRARAGRHSELGAEAARGRRVAGVVYRLGLAMLKTRFALLCCVLFSCATVPASQPTAEVAAPARVPAATATVVAKPMPTPLGKRLLLVDAAFANLEPAIADFGLETSGRDCLLTFNETEEWLIGCPEMSGQAGFAETGEVWQGKRILWNPKSLTLSDQHLPYEKVKMAIVGTVGRHTRDDADKTADPVLMVQDWAALHKNHPGFQQSGVEEWLGIFVHEAFHARQIWHPRVQHLTARWSRQNPPATANELLAFFNGNEAFRAALGKEMEVLTAATNDPQLAPAQAKAALAQWLGLYRQREKNFADAMETALPGKDVWFMDGFETFLEGTARYVEARFLMSPLPQTVDLLKAEPTSMSFASSLGKRPSQLPGLGKLGQKYFYAIGMHLSFVLDAADPTWKVKLFDSERLLIGQVERVVAAKGP